MPNRVDSIISHGAGAAHAIKARWHGLVGVFETLSAQHGEAGALLKRIKADPTRRADLWPKIRAELISHEKGELAVVYPALRERPETRDLAERHDVEAKQLSAAIEALHTTDMALPVWGELLDKLIELVTQHVTEEEGEIFPAAQRLLGDQKARALDQPFLEAKKHAMLTYTT